MCGRRIQAKTRKNQRKRMRLWNKEKRRAELHLDLAQGLAAEGQISVSRRPRSRRESRGDALSLPWNDGEPVLEIRCGNK